MSAYIVDGATLDYLVSFASNGRREVSVYVPRDAVDTWIPAELANEPVRGNRWKVAGNEDVAWAILMHQNWRSVERRYEGQYAEEFARDALLRPFRLRGETRPLWVLKCCDCYDYQASETPDYTGTFAAALVNAIRHAAIRALPGYEDAPWGVDDEQAGPVVVSLAQMGRRRRA